MKYVDILEKPKSVIALFGIVPKICYQISAQHFYVITETVNPHKY